MSERPFEERLREYGSVIDQRLDAGPALGAGSGSRVRLRDRSATGARLFVAACVLAIVVTLALAALFQARDTKPVASPGTFELELDDVPEGISLRRLGDEPVFLRRTGREIVAFVVDVRHLAGEPLWWCPREELFAAPTHGEMFDKEGRKIGGPARGGLNRYLVQVDGARLTIETSHVTEGSSARDGVPSTARSESDEPWASGPNAFCYGAIKSS